MRPRWPPIYTVLRAPPPGVLPGHLQLWQLGFTSQLQMVRQCPTPAVTYVPSRMLTLFASDHQSDKHL